MNFESGVKKYIKGTATIVNYFPVDFNDRADISCLQCKFFSRNNRLCQISKEITAYPNKFVGQNCPLIREDDE